MYSQTQLHYIIFVLVTSFDLGRAMLGKTFYKNVNARVYKVSSVSVMAHKFCIEIFGR
jgi:hypothetical protein